MSKYIDADKAIDAISTCKGQRCYEDRDMYIKRVLNELPPADVVEVVRCKDCEYWDKDEDVLGGRCDEWSDFEDGLTRYTKGDDYCSLGERKEQEHEQDARDNSNSDI